MATRMAKRKDRGNGSPQIPTAPRRGQLLPPHKRRPMGRRPRSRMDRARHTPPHHRHRQKQTALLGQADRQAETAREGRRSARRRARRSHRRLMGNRMARTRREIHETVHVQSVRGYRAHLDHPDGRTPPPRPARPAGHARPHRRDGRRRTLVDVAGAGAAAPRENTPRRDRRGTRRAPAGAPRPRPEKRRHRPVRDPVRGRHANPRRRARPPGRLPMGSRPVAGAAAGRNARPHMGVRRP